MNDKDVIIIGAGIGGLTTALMLHDKGIPVRVFEAVESVRELGVGINVLPHAIRHLAKVGLLDDVVRAGIQAKELSYFNKWGQPIWREPRGLDAGYKWPQVSIHRGRLQSVLFEAAKARIGEDRIFTGHRFTGFEEEGDGVTARFDGQPDQHGSLLVAVDGIHSQARRLFYPDEGPPRYSGLFMWRAVSRGKPYLSGATMAVVGHQSVRFVGYPITVPDETGDCDINWIAHLLRPEMPEREDWSREGKLQDFLPEFGDWAYDWLDIPALYKSADTNYEFPMVDRDPLPQWSFGRVTLLGDAAHPMYPIGSNGASQAILDAAAVADALSEIEDPVAALKAYEAARLPATAAIVAANRQNGPEIVMQMAEDRAPQGFKHIEDVIPRAELEAITDKYRVLAGFDKEQLNKAG